MKQSNQVKIENVKTLKEFLNVLQTEFKTEECKPSRFIKSTLIYTLISKLSAQNVIVTSAIKTRATETESIQEFINVVKANFNCEQQFTNTKNLVKETEILLKLTGLKEKD